MGWQLEVLEGVAATASDIGSGVYNVLSSTPLSAFLVDNATLEALKQISGTEIAPLVNDLGETIGYVGQTAASSNGSTALSTAWMTITREAQVVTQELIDAAIPLVGGGTTADLELGQEITRAGLAAGAGVGGAAGTGVGTTALATVAGPAIAAALGVAAGTALYNIAPEFWTSVEQSLEAAGKTIGGKIISFFKPDGTEYYDDEIINIVQQALIDSGYLSNSSESTLLDQSPLRYKNWQMPLNFTTGSVCTWPSTGNTVKVHTCSQDAYFFWPTRYNTSLSDNSVFNCPFFVSRDYFTMDVARYDSDGNVVGSVEHRTPYTLTRGGVTYYINSINNGSTMPYSDFLTNHIIQPKVVTITPSATGYDIGADAGYIIEFGTAGDTPSPNTLPRESNGDNRYVSPVPTSVTDPIHNPTQNPNQNPTDLYDPTPTVTPGPEDSPSPDVDPDPQPDPETEPAPDPHPTSPTAPQDPTNPNPPGNNDDEGDPEAPPVVIPMAASALSKVFNPTQAETDALGHYLWSSTNIEDILKLFQNPIDGIIGFMKLYATPVTGSHANIKLGYLDSGVSAAVVTQQIVTIDCGTITIPGDKANATDYPPYTTMQIYLPFIGIEPLNAYDLIGSQLTVRYRVDCYTGACIAQLKVARDNLSSVLYEFSGNCAQQIPLTSGNYLQLAGNIISGAITGGVHGGMVGAAIGAGSSLIHSNVEVGRSGNLSANAGMLGCRVPYVIITRAVSADAANYRDFYGYPSNKTVYLKNCSGYTRVKDIILHTSATQAERNEIEQLLHQGIII